MKLQLMLTLAGAALMLTPTVGRAELRPNSSTKPIACSATASIATARASTCPAFR